MSGHTATPGPWKIYDDADPHHIKILGTHPDIGNAHVADVLFPANAAFIVTACNSHADLVKALEFFADGKNWLLNGPCDPNSGNFQGQQFAEQALATLTARKVG